MAVEVYSNNASTTVAIGGYTPASGVLNVASTGSPFLSVATGVRQMHLLVYRIIGGLITPIVNFVATNTVSGTQWAVTAEGSDNAALVGDIVICVLSSGGMNQIRADVNQFGPIASLPATTNQKSGNRYKCSDSPYEYIFDGTNWIPYAYGFKCVEPVLANFTQVNFSSAGVTTDTTHGGIVFGAPSLGSSTQIGYIAQAIPGSGAYSVDVAFTLGLTGGNQGVGVGLSGGALTSSAFCILFFGPTGSPPNTSLAMNQYNSTSSFNSQAFVQFCQLVGPLVWLRTTDDRTTNKTYSFSVDGLNWIQVYSQSRTSISTPADAMFGISPFAGGVYCHLLHFSVHA